jgi:hypothetical protein
MHGIDVMHTKLWSENLKGRDCAKDLQEDGVIISECIIGKYSGKLWTEFILLRIGTTGSL